MNLIDPLVQWRSQTRFKLIVLSSTFFLQWPDLCKVHIWGDASIQKIKQGTVVDRCIAKQFHDCHVTGWAQGLFFFLAIILYMMWLRWLLMANCSSNRNGEMIRSLSTSHYFRRHEYNNSSYDTNVLCVSLWWSSRRLLLSSFLGACPPNSPPSSMQQKVLWKRQLYYDTAIKRDENSTSFGRF